MKTTLQLGFFQAGELSKKKPSNIRIKKEEIE